METSSKVVGTSRTITLQVDAARVGVFGFFAGACATAELLAGMIYVRPSGVGLGGVHGRGR